MVHSQSIHQDTKRDLEILTKATALEGFYLAGGTGLAMHLGHRESIDLDFFRQEAFSEDQLLATISPLGKYELDKKEKGTLVGRFNSTLLSTFHYPYSLLEETLKWEGIEIASVIDIACMKLDAVASRGTKKDFVDLYFITHEGKYSLESMLEAFERKFAKVQYNLMHIKKSLVYFADAESDPMPKMHEPIDWAKVKSYFEKEVPKL